LENVHVFYGHLEHLTGIWYILWSLGTFCGHLVCIYMVIWYILWSFGIYFPVLVFCTKKILATRDKDEIILDAYLRTYVHTYIHTRVQLFFDCDKLSMTLMRLGALFFAQRYFIVLRRRKNNEPVGLRPRVTR
jgi:hypothetical protein